MRTLLAPVAVFFLCSLGLCMATRHDRPSSAHEKLASEARFDAVCYVGVEGSGSGSGTLVAAQWVLTAAHVVEDKDPKQVRIRFGDKRCLVAQIVIHPEYRPKGVPSKSDNLIKKGVDVALLKLSEPVQGIAPATLNSEGNEKGKRALFVGFGTYGAGGEVVTKPQPSGVKRAGENMVDAIGSGVPGRDIPPFLLVGDFDAPGRPDFNKTGDAAALDLECNPVGGDSGGGMFLEEGGKLILSGVFVTSTIAQTPDIKRDGI